MRGPCAHFIGAGVFLRQALRATGRPSTGFIAFDRWRYAVHWAFRPKRSQSATLQTRFDVRALNNSRNIQWLIYTLQESCLWNLARRRLAGTSNNSW